MGFRLGIDIGSTTIKIAIIDKANKLVFSKYQRHFSNIKETLALMVQEAKNELGNIKTKAMITGSGGLSLAKNVGVKFIQEVVSVSTAIERFSPKTDVAIEIGGEDAKIIYLKNGLEQRMNGICAGGTGSFIDQMAALLQTDAMGLNEYAKNYKTIYPIAARCGVFAKSDIQPLINEGAAKEDLAVSIFQAIVNQTISGLACGKPIRGNVCFLGGPLHFLSELRSRFVDVLGLTDETAIIPENSHLFAALGAAITSEETGEITFDTIIDNVSGESKLEFEIQRLDPLFNSENEYQEFSSRHEKNKVVKLPLEEYSGNAFLGIDAGSTTTKVALVGENGELLYSYYGSNEASPIKVMIKALSELYAKKPASVTIKNSCATGYGEALAQSAFRVDLGEIETVAHYKAAAFFAPDVDFILDIGGQDMKCMTINDGVIENVILNEACSAGCGSFIETFAISLSQKIQEFAKNALFAKNPIDLGSRCTVFMNSRVKQAQKEGAEVSDISSGLAYSVIKNALHKVIKITDPSEMGKRIVVQGGTFYNEAVLRAFEVISEREAVRPDIAGIMGAFGSAIIAKERFQEGHETKLLSLEEIEKLEMKSTNARCNLCGNSCLLTINTFDDRKIISGNRCEKPTPKASIQKDVINLFDYKYRRLFDYTPLTEDKAHRGIVGLPRVLNMYENYPMWFTFFTELGYKVQLSPESSREVYEKGIESMPSESVCYPAKLVHGHIMELINDGVKFIFYPSIAYERQEIEGADNHFNCPIVTSYPENIKNNVEEIKELGIDFRNPFFNIGHKESFLKRLIEEFAYINKNDIKQAFEKAWAEQDKFRQDVCQKGEESLKIIKEKGLRAVILAGRPYHLDPEIHHGIPELITSYGVAVLPEDSVSHLAKVERPLRVLDQWSYHSRLYAAATLVQTIDGVELVQLNSFGCGLDAVTTDEINDLLSAAGKIYTCLKIDEVSNLGSARIRIRSLFAALDERERKGIKVKKATKRPERVVFTKEMRKNHTILSPQMSPVHFDILEQAFNAGGYNLKVMPAMDRESVDIGLKYVNNDACYPSVIVVGQLLKALQSGDYDVNNTSVLITQTGGGCRATNYIAFIRRALEKANLGHVPVVSLNASGLEKNPGLSFTPKFLSRLMQALVYGDLFMRVLYKVRPYEKVVGSANALYEKWNNICKESVKTATFKEFRKNIEGIVKEFDELEILDIPKPKVGVVGEILVKYHPTANNDIVTLIEQEGAEAVVPDLIDFLTYSLYNANYKERYLGKSKKSRISANIAIRVIEAYRKHLKKTLEKSSRFTPPVEIDKLAKLAEPIVSIGNQTGEGWFLTAEMVELIHSGVNNIVCTQPFACLPNHVTGKGIIKELKNQYPLSNVVAIDYDPGASEVNQLNRIKLMLTVAKKNLDAESSYREVPDKDVIKVGHV